MTRTTVLLSLLALGTACSSSAGTSPVSPQPSAAASAKYSYAYTTPAGQETHWCQYTKLPKTDGSDLIVSGYKWQWQGLHHWAIYQTTADLPADVDTTTPFDCFQTGAMKYARPAALLLAGGAQGERKFPDTTGFAFKSEEIVIVQAHSVNTGTTDAHLSLEMELELGDPAATPNHLGLLQFYDPYIVVPAHATATAQMRCKIPQDMTAVFATTHQHLRGTGVAALLDAPDGTLGTSPFVSSSNWDTPPVVDGPIALAAGSSVRTICSYQGGEQDVIQGQDKIDNEMCMFVGYYYPVVDSPQEGFFENCVQTPIPGGVGDSYGTGGNTCSQALACIQTCPPGDAPNPHDGHIDVGKCWQECLVSSCPSASAPLNAVGYCVQTQCAAECAPGGNCPACVLSKCSTEYNACAAHKCG